MKLPLLLNLTLKAITTTMPAPTSSLSPTIAAPTTSPSFYSPLFIFPYPVPKKALPLSIFEHRAQNTTATANVTVAIKNIVSSLEAPPLPSLPPPAQNATGAARLMAVIEEATSKLGAPTPVHTALPTAALSENVTVDFLTNDFDHWKSKYAPPQPLEPLPNPILNTTTDKAMAAVKEATSLLGNMASAHTRTPTPASHIVRENNTIKYKHPFHTLHTQTMKRTIYAHTLPVLPPHIHHTSITPYPTVAAPTSAPTCTRTVRLPLHFPGPPRPHRPTTTYLSTTTHTQYVDCHDCALAVKTLGVGHGPVEIQDVGYRPTVITKAVETVRVASCKQSITVF